MEPHTPSPLPISSRLLLGALAGLAGTMAMTSAMSRLHRRLPPREQYPLPPREITATVLPDVPDKTVRDSAMAAHFAYGAATGAIIAGVRPQIGLIGGALYGVGVWGASYFGWVPALGILRPANEHPMRRNALMIGVHLVWGAMTALSLRELDIARRTMLRAGPPRDRDRKR
jgi:uncharacterized membrane protein YagU involved in acid resistance